MNLKKACLFVFLRISLVIGATWDVGVKTGSESGVSSDAGEVCIEIFGNNGRISSTNLDKSGRDDFEIGALDDFRLYGTVGRPYKIIFTKTVKDHWHLKYVTLSNGRMNYICNCDWHSGSGPLRKVCGCCLSVQNCQEGMVRCYGRRKGTCLKCIEENVDVLHSFHWPSHTRTMCEETCSYRENWCWPGNCSNHLKSSCICSPDFKKIDGKCVLATKPSLQTCRMGVESAGGIMRNSTSNGTCLNERDTYINFDPKALSYTFETQIGITIPPTNPFHISESGFGLVKRSVSIFLYRISGRIPSKITNTGMKCNRDISDIHPLPTALLNCHGNIAISPTLSNGDKICIMFKSQAGGYLKTKDFSNHALTPHIFQRTTSTKEVCFHFDDAAPEHCSAIDACTEDPIQLSSRVSFTANISVLFRDWEDPFPKAGTKDQASGIDYYEVSIHEVSQNQSTLTMKDGPINGFTKREYADSHVQQINFSLPTEPAIYGIVLDVMDIAGNFRTARRFLLYDNSSNIQINGMHKLYVKTASSKTNFTWQIHHGLLCSSWKGRYYNSYHKRNNLLGKINAGFHLLFHGVYEQNTGVLPISGTTNVDGIVEFGYVLRSTNRNFVTHAATPNVLSEDVCINTTLNDGDTFVFQITPKDIMGRQISESVTVHIDSSIPEIDNLGLMKDTNDVLFVHNTTDLSSMAVHFDAKDVHSGLYSILWRLGTQPNSDSIGSGSLGVQELRNATSCPDHPCYCPKVGVCENFHYRVSFNSLIANNTNEGNHNREYYFTLIVTNKARLININRIDILVDDSPPVSGVIAEGTMDESDIDFTSSNELHVHWSGFIDHESGIRQYTVGIADHCLTIEDMLNNKSKSAFIKETSTNSILFDLPHEGKYFASIVAFNNAMEPSEVVCSDSVVFDLSPPEISGVFLNHARAADVVTCFDDTPYLVTGNLTSFSLEQTYSCTEFCKHSNISMKMLPTLPLGIKPYNDSDFADHICQHQRRFSNDWFIYVPRDTIQLTWTITDDESQMENVFVGFASDPSYSVRPDLVDYAPTQTYTMYVKYHEGLDRGVPFYILLKAVNKANLETIVSYGPVIIDQTPPVFSGDLFTLVKGRYIYVYWKNDSFKDMEQRERIDTILFRAGHGRSYITPYLESQIENSCPNESFSCFRYPVRRLQIQDAEESLNFYFELYAYNLAGIFSVIKTEAFQVPSRFPPGHGLVFDLDPENTNGTSDIDFQFSRSKACARWSGFHHHRNVMIKIGLGSEKKTDDVVALAPANSESDFHCMNPRNLTFKQKYYIIVEASCSGGKTRVASDGFVVIDNEEYSKAMTIVDGRQCTEESISKQPLTHSNTSNVTEYTLPTLLAVDVPYELSVSCPSNQKILISSRDLLVNSLWKHDNTWLIRGLVERPSVTFTFKKTMNESCLLSLRSCYEISTQSDNSQYEAHVNIDSLLPKYITHYEYAVFKSDFHSGNNEKPRLDLVVPFHRVRERNILHVTNMVLEDTVKYISSVRACFDKICTDPVFSKGVIVQNRPPITEAFNGTMQNSLFGCTEVSATFRPFRCSGNQTAIMYQWAVSKADDGRVLVSNWFPVNEKDGLSVNDCPRLNVYTSQTLYLCIKGYCSSGTNNIKCGELSNLRNENEYPTNIVYEFDASWNGIGKIKKSIDTMYAGKNLAIMHEHELEYCKKDTLIAGVVLDAGDRYVDWYITDVPNISGKTCQEDSHCYSYEQTKGGFVAFNRFYLKNRAQYFVCARSNKTIVTREHFREELPGFTICGNGFVVDNDPPKPGKVSLPQSRDGFITSSTELVITWSKFTDVEEYVNTTGISGIESMFYSIGTHPMGQDVVPFTKTSGSLVIARNINLQGGMTYFATVKAVDHVGLETYSVSDQVICDVTPPVDGIIAVGNELYSYDFLSTTEVIVHWERFYDDESGIAEFQMGIGSSPNSTDILGLEVVDGLSHRLSGGKTFLDGHFYYVILSVKNYAGLSTVVSSEAFVIDSTPPMTGVVKDGARNCSVDIDYQTDTRVLRAHWNGFLDHHSGVRYYEVGIGSSPYKTDVATYYHVGMITEYGWNGIFSPGTKYYVTVKACNGASLCSETSSDGIIMDNSPPVPGIVHVGRSDKHEHFYGHRSSFSMQWIGFQDPHSDISHFDWCLGRIPEQCDVVPRENALLSSSVTKTGISLPLNVSLYGTVWAVNNVGLETVRHSPSFQIDVTPPYVVSYPEFVLHGTTISSNNVSQWDNSLLRIRWSFGDNESPILSHTIILKSSKNGRLVSETETCGSQNKRTILLKNGNLLRDGDKYVAMVTSCNAAGLCSVAQSSELLIDSSPPQMGGFTKDMTWENINNNSTNFTIVNIQWYGFEDVESEITQYYISVSKTFSGSELSGDVLRIDPSSKEKQSLSLNLTRQLESTSQIILSVWATNGVGLRSQTGRVTVTLVATDVSQTRGNLEIQRHSCVSHYCNDDCTCAVVGYPCETNQGSGKCFDVNLNKSAKKTEVKVNIGNNFGFHQNITASSSCLSSHWLVDQRDIEILRFEWSVGVADGKPGEELFDIQKEKIWYDVGLDKHFEFCSNNGRRFVHKLKYIVYVKIWFSKNRFSVHHSEPVLVDRTPALAVTGSSIMESEDECETDVEFTKNRNVTVCWKDVFSEQQGHILHYEIMGGTHPYGSDLIRMTNVGLADQFALRSTNLDPGKRYYFTIMSMNSVGLISSLVSDGFVIDEDFPVSGVVYNTNKFRNIHFQASLNSVGVSWEGFDDHHSYIESYEVSLYDVSAGTTNLISVINGMENRIELNNLKLAHNMSYKLSVVAHDGVGHVSDPIFSPVLRIDTTPPTGFVCQTFTPMLLSNVSDLLDDEVHLRKFHLLYRGSLLVQRDQYYRLNIKLDFLPRHKIVLQIKGEFIPLDFAQSRDGNQFTEYSFISYEYENLTLTLLITGQENESSFTVSIDHCERVIDTDDDVVIVFQVGPSSLFVSYAIHDRESELSSFVIGVGTTENGFQIQSLSPVGKRRYSVINARISHRSPVHVTVIAKNNAGLYEKYKSPKIIFDQTGPVISHLKVDISYFPIKKTLTTNNTVNSTSEAPYAPANSTNETMNNGQEKTLSNIEMRWSTFDNESGVKLCRCSIGLSPDSTSIQRWLLADSSNKCQFSDLKLQHGIKIYPAVECTNNVDLKSKKISDGIMVSYERPDANSAIFNFIPNNEGHSIPAAPSIAGNVQSDQNSVLYQWYNFIDESGISVYNTKVIGDDGRILEEGTTTVPFKQSNLRMQDGSSYTLQVGATNIGNVTSTCLNSSFHILSSTPTLSGKAVSVIKTKDTMRINWNGVYTSTPYTYLTYQVSVGTKRGHSDLQ